MKWTLEIPKEETLSFLCNVESRSVRSTNGDIGDRQAWEVQINFRGQWIRLARTSWSDDVCTGSYLYGEQSNNPGALVAKYREACSMDHWGCNDIGARVLLGSSPVFAVIDRASDG